ncbi:SRPBCC domain-containing protein [Aeromicrobium sp. CF4.19]|uniref:SRPBCC family protein n=1 Tax=Aeromicrobium sp. CF4.19 TaxID=3373082 RepID=UPI003EE6143C
MFAHQRTITAPVPRRWVWAALADPRHLASWGPIDRCEVDHVDVLRPGLEVSCVVELLGRPVGATLCVLEVEPQRYLGLRLEMLAATVYECLTLTPDGSTSTHVDLELDVMTPLPSDAIHQWVDQHAEEMTAGLTQFLHLESAAIGRPSSPPV